MRYSEGLQGFSEEALKSATFGREVLDVKQEFFLHGGVPLADAGGAATGGYVRQDKGGIGAAAVEAKISDEKKPVYFALKDWRNKLAKTKGCPAYAIARNIQLAEIVIKSPKSLAELKEIEGCGESFCKQYGDEVLTLLAEVKPSIVPDASDERCDKGEDAARESKSEGSENDQSATEESSMTHVSEQELELK